MASRNKDEKVTCLKKKPRPFPATNTSKDMSQMMRLLCTTEPKDEGLTRHVAKAQDPGGPERQTSLLPKPKIQLHAVAVGLQDFCAGEANRHRERFAEEIVPAAGPSLSQTRLRTELRDRGESTSSANIMRQVTDSSGWRRARCSQQKTLNRMP